MAPALCDYVVNILDLGEIRLVFGSTDEDGTYEMRQDLAPDGTINILDVGELRPFFNKQCAP